MSPPTEDSRRQSANEKPAALNANGTYTPSEDFCHLCKCDVPPGPLTADEVLALLVGSGALTKAAATGNRWQRALRPALALAHQTTDEWEHYEIHKRPTELCVRWDYDAAKDAWESSETLVKIEEKSFARGAMRECFRMKKMSQVTAAYFYRWNWKECNNYVAKRYIPTEKEPEGAPRERYFADIQMQMISKRYARQFNALSPPKKVDFLHAFVIEVTRDGEKVLFCVERAIEGNYIKYNNNSGFVEHDEHGHARATPHAFSRFTFGASKGAVQIVDIQGVGDIYTDPQIHSLNGVDFGEGNLGVGGMALFFSTASYDGLCKLLKLPNFALSPSEEKRVHSASHSPRASATDDPSPAEQTYVATAAASVIASASAVLSRRRSSLSAAGGAPTDEIGAKDLPSHFLGDSAEAAEARAEAALPELPPAKPPDATGPIAPPPAVVGLVHARLCELNLAGALPYLEDKPDLRSAAFHLACAAAAGEPRALRDLRSLIRGLSADELLPGVTLAEAAQQSLTSLIPLLTNMLAGTGDVSAMVEAANASAMLGGGEVEAAAWLRGAIRGLDALPAAERTQLAMSGAARHQLLNRLAEVLLDAGDNAAASASYEEASEAAMEAGKAKLAMKYSGLAEECAPEEEEEAVQEAAAAVAVD